MTDEIRCIQSLASIRPLARALAAELQVWCDEQFRSSKCAGALFAISEQNALDLLKVIDVVSDVTEHWPPTWPSVSLCMHRQEAKQMVVTQPLFIAQELSRMRTHNLPYMEKMWSCNYNGPQGNPLDLPKLKYLIERTLKIKRTARLWHEFSKTRKDVTFEEFAKAAGCEVCSDWTTSCDSVIGARPHPGITKP